MNRGRREAGDPPPRRLLRILGSLLYWLAVILISLALVIGLVLLLESQDASDIGGPRSEGSRLRDRASGTRCVQKPRFVARRCKAGGRPLARAAHIRPGV